VKSAIRAASPPAKPLILYDGDCAFCAFWILRWQRATWQLVDFLPFQHDTIGARFPELRSNQLATTIHLVETDGSIYTGAEAVFRALACNSARHWPIDWYERFPVFARWSETAYSFVAEHRAFFSLLTRMAWGGHADPPSHLLIRSIFLRSIGVIYLIAFLSLWVQISGLVGSNGILPAKLSIDAMRQNATAQHIGVDRYRVLPTLCWLSASDTSLNIQCGAGAILASLLIIGFAPAPCLFLLWLLYLSLASINREFLGFQWDNLLLETGFLAIFLAPLQLRPSLARAPPPSRLVLWLLRWLLFRLMFESGCVKLLSGDPAWRNLTALTVHYETQPLPTWIGWYVHQLPIWAQKTSTVLMFIIELVIPFLIFAPRRPRHAACAALVALQIVIFLTGNYCFFNLLTIALCLLLLDDAALLKMVPQKWQSAVTAIHHPSPIIRRVRWPRQILKTLACITVAISTIQLVSMFQLRFPWPGPVMWVYEWVTPFRTINTYGLFAVMTMTRPEIIIQGSKDGTTWVEYEFRYKPVGLKQRPKFVEPHQPRLDWQMWFAALGSYRQNPWFVNFCARLLDGSPEVVRLLKRNPFPAGPPRYIRAVVYEYHFTDWRTWRQTGAWWRRELKGLYIPTISRRAAEPAAPPAAKAH